MSNSYIIALERLRAQLENILRGKGLTVSSGETLNSLVAKVGGIGSNSLLAAILKGNTDFSIDDTEGCITSVDTLNLSGNTRLTSLSLSAATSVCARAFKNCTNLLTVNLPEVISIAGGSSDYGAFCNCQRLTSVSFPKVETIAQQAFRYCSALTSLVIPATLTLYGDLSFSECTSLSRVEINSSTEIANRCFNSCTSLNTLIINVSSQVVPLGNVSAFAGTPFRTSVGGTVYVPDSLVSSYQSASNWSALENATFKGLSELEE